ncbi:hypothetical protein ACZ87_03816, partial [Candidatus Erwinia dacicola]
MEEIGAEPHIAPDHLFLAQRLAFMLPRAVNEVVVDHRA